MEGADSRTHQESHPNTNLVAEIIVSLGFITDLSHLDKH